MAHVITRQGKKKTTKKMKYKNKNKMCRGGGGNLLFALSDLYHNATVGTVFLAAINRPSASPPTDHQLQPSPSPHLQKRKTRAATESPGILNLALQRCVIGPY